MPTSRPREKHVNLILQPFFFLISSKLVPDFTIHNSLIYIYIYIYVCVCVCVIHFYFLLIPIFYFGRVKKTTNNLTCE